MEGKNVNMNILGSDEYKLKNKKKCRKSQYYAAMCKKKIYY